MLLLLAGAIDEAFDPWPLRVACGGGETGQRLKLYIGVAALTKHVS